MWREKGMETWDLLAAETFAVILSKVGGSLLMCRKFNSLFLKCKLGRIYSIVKTCKIWDCYLHSHGTENSDLCGKHPPAEQMMLVVLINRYRDRYDRRVICGMDRKDGFTRTPTTEPGNAENLDSRCFTRPTFILNCLNLWTQYQLAPSCFEKKYQMNDRLQISQNGLGREKLPGSGWVQAPSIVPTFWFLALDICLKVQKKLSTLFFLKHGISWEI